VQKSFLGAEISEYDYQNAAKYSLNASSTDYTGVLVEDISRSSSAAKNAGLKPLDVITKINDYEINSKSAFEEEISYRSPGDVINITYVRDGKSNTVAVTLLNKNGDTKLIKRKFYDGGVIGATLEEVDFGVKAFKIRDGLFKKLGVPENYTIVYINRQRVKNPQDVIEFFSSYKGNVFIQGINSSKQEIPFSFYLQQ
jgi:S1-C subfamily serine protease